MKTLGDLIDEGIHVRREAVRVIVTPVCAARALQFNVQNRYMRRSNFEYYCLVISSGQWQDDHTQGISFSNTGRLIDGQHRLLAIQKVGRPVIVRVDTGCNEELQKHLDGGVPRSLPDRTAFAENKQLNKRTTEILRAYATIKMNDTRKMPVAFFESLYAEWQSECDQVAEYYVEKKGRIGTKGTLRGGVFAAYMEAMRKDGATAVALMDSVTFPEGQLQPGRALREWLLRNSSSGGMKSLIQSYRATWAAIEAALKNKTLKQLRPLDRELRTIGYPLKNSVS